MTDLEIFKLEMKEDLRKRRELLVTQLDMLCRMGDDGYSVALCKGRIFELERIFWDLFPKEELVEKCN